MFRLNQIATDKAKSDLEVAQYELKSGTQKVNPNPNPNPHPKPDPKIVKVEFHKLRFSRHGVLIRERVQPLQFRQKELKLRETSGQVKSTFMIYKHNSWFAMSP